MRSGSFPPALVAAAEFERDRRAARYPRLVARRELDAEAANLDYQAWHCIVEWMRAGRCCLIGGWGGIAEPPVHVISWALLEQAAEKAVATIEDKLGKEIAFAEGRPGAGFPAGRPPLSPDALAVLRDRRESIWTIHQILVRQRESMDRLSVQTEEARARWRAESAAA